MSCIHGVQTQFLQAIGVIVTGIALQMHWVSNGNTLQPPLVGFAPLLDVSHQLVLLYMFVSFAMQLKVGLQLGVVTTEIALVRIPHHGLPLLLRQVAFSSHVQAQHVQVVGREAVAYGALKEFQGRVVGLGKTLAKVHELLRDQLSTTQPHVQRDFTAH